LLWIALSAAAVWAITAGPGLADAPSIGDVERVERNCYGTPPGASQEPKHAGNPVVHEEVLETLTDSAALIRFVDGSKLTLGAKSTVKLDNFTFDANRQTGQALLNMTGGAIRFVTGSMPKGGVTIQTPTATMVLRGTDVSVTVKPNGDTTLNVHRGLVETKSVGTGQTKSVPAGASVKVGQGGFSGGGEGQGADQGDQGSGSNSGVEPTGDSAVDNGMGGGTGGGNSTQSGQSTSGGSSGNGGSRGGGGDSEGGSQNSGGGHGNNGHM